MSKKKGTNFMSEHTHFKVLVIEQESKEVQRFPLFSIPIITIIAKQNKK